MNDYSMSDSEVQSESAKTPAIPVTGAAAKAVSCAVCGSTNCRHVLTEYGRSLFCEDCAALFGFDQVRGVKDGSKQ